MPDLAGLILAAGAGRRFGGPKALARRSDGTPWLCIAADRLRSVGAVPVVVLGAAADEAASLVPAGVRTVVVGDWTEGLGASLRAGLLAVADADAVVVTLVDLPDLPASVYERVVAEPIGNQALRQAVFDGRPGHPVVIGRAHLAPLAASLRGDHGARAHLLGHGVLEIECGDLADGRDRDRP